MIFVRVALIASGDCAGQHEFHQIASVTIKTTLELAASGPLDVDGVQCDSRWIEAGRSRPQFAIGHRRRRHRQRNRHRPRRHEGPVAGETVAGLGAAAGLARAPSGERENGTVALVRRPADPVAGRRQFWRCLPGADHRPVGDRAGRRDPTRRRLRRRPRGYGRPTTDHHNHHH